MIYSKFINEQVGYFHCDAVLKKRLIFSPKYFGDQLMRIVTIFKQNVALPQHCISRCNYTLGLSSPCTKSVGGSFLSLSSPSRLIYNVRVGTATPISRFSNSSWILKLMACCISM